MSRRVVRVLVVDDSALVRSVLRHGFARDQELVVVGEARDPYEARDLLVKLRPDVMTLDLEMPRMDGLAFLRKFMSVLPTPTVVLSSLARQDSQIVQQVLAAGAVDVMSKPRVGVEQSLEQSMQALIERVKRAANKRPQRRSVVHEVAEPPPRSALEATSEQLIALGASTGGVSVLGRVLPALPAWTPGVVIVQHMAAGFTAQFAKRLDEQCAMRVREAHDGARVLRGQILVAPGGDQHLEVHRVGGEYRVRLRQGAPVSGHVPSVDVFFASVAHSAATNAYGVLLTGMGTDGARGLLEMRLAGAATAIQDRESCAVWGMPAAAQQLGACERELAMNDVAAALVAWSNSRG